MDNPRVTYAPHPVTAPEAELSALAAIYTLVLSNSQAKKGGTNELTNESTKKRTTGPGKKGKNNADILATDCEPVAPGLYTARLEKIEEATSQHGTYYRWCFVIEDEDEQEDRRIYANVSDKFGPQSKARRWCEQMVGRAIRKGEQFDTEVLLGKSYHIMVTNTPEDERGRVYDNVGDVHCIRPKAEPKQEKAGKPEASEGEFNDIPW